MSLKINDINGRLENLRKYFNCNQMAAIEYAFFNLETGQAEKILDKNIPARYMSLYAILMKNGIPVDQFIAEGYHADEIRCEEIDKIYMQLEKFKKKMKELEENGKYSNEQLMALKEAYKIIGQQVYLLIDYNISSEYITKYATIIKSGISVDKFIGDGYHLDDTKKDEINSVYDQVQEFNDTIDQIRKVGKMNEQQIIALEEAFAQIGGSVYILVNYTIPSEYIRKYAYLMSNCVDISGFIFSESHLSAEGQSEIDAIYNDTITANADKTLRITRPSA